jgi:hypothetical protein
MEGSGPRWALIAQLFDTQCKRLGLNRERVGEAEQVNTFVRPRKQLSLF